MGDMDAYPMFSRCKRHQPDNLEANQDPKIWALLHANGFISRESTNAYPQGISEGGGRYPGYYPLDETIPGGMPPHGP